MSLPSIVDWIIFRHMAGAVCVRMWSGSLCFSLVLEIISSFAHLNNNKPQLLCVSAELNWQW